MRTLITIAVLIIGTLSVLGTAHAQSTEEPAVAWPGVADSDLKWIDFGAIGTDPVHQPLRGEETNIIKDIAPLRWFTCLRRLEITDELPTIKRYRT